jgi:hypothetical protein
MRSSSRQRSSQPPARALERRHDDEATRESDGRRLRKSDSGRMREIDAARTGEPTAPISATRAHADALRTRIGAWLIAPTLIAATATGILFVLRGPDRFFGYAVATLFALAVAWMLISVFFPAAPERKCPQCGRESLRRLDARTLHGVACSACGYSDAEQSAFLMAEEEGSIESIVLSERRNAHASAAREKAH